MNAIVAVDNNWAIGCKNSLLVRIPADHKYFRQETTAVKNWTKSLKNMIRKISTLSEGKAFIG